MTEKDSYSVCFWPAAEDDRFAAVDLFPGGKILLHALAQFQGLVPGRIFLEYWYDGTAGLD